ncbi:MAG: hypothetical protein M0Q42_00885 [Xanthomonadales bacterium]|nr:hypothetical protein [Xanthomonadales bacterium]
MLDFPGERGIVAGIGVIRIEAINEACAWMIIGSASLADSRCARQFRATIHMG